MAPKADHEHGERDDDGGVSPSRGGVSSSFDAAPKTSAKARSSPYPAAASETTLRTLLPDRMAEKWAEGSIADRPLHFNDFCSVHSL